jgi:hypothetical protein
VCPTRTTTDERSDRIRHPSLIATREHTTTGERSDRIRHPSLIASRGRGDGDIIRR